MSNNYSVTVTEEQLTDIMELFSMTKPELKARKLAAPKPVSAALGHTPPSDTMAQAFGGVSDELQAWMDARRNPNYRSTYKPVTPYKHTAKKGAFSKAAMEQSERWDHDAKVAWKALGNNYAEDMAGAHSAPTLTPTNR